MRIFYFPFVPSFLLSVIGLIRAKEKVSGVNSPAYEIKTF
jgi:hypothetical protein